MEASNEQIKVVEALCEGKNVVVDAVAGSGKTTTITFIAETLPAKRILILTYNRKLKEETRYRLQEYENVDVHNYHSLVQAYFQIPCQDDKMMSEFLKAPPKEKVDLPDFDLIILDEVQDMTPIYFQLVHFIRKQMIHTSPQLCCLGDRMQCIYQFMKADQRFITYCKEVFGAFNDLPWIQEPISLRTSYRMTQPTTDFLNQVFLAEERLEGYRATGQKPVYIHANLFNLSNEFRWVRRVLEAIHEHGPGNTFVLAPSLRGARSPVRLLENFLVQSLKLPCYVPTADERELNQPAMSGKIVFSTFHQSKGMERDLVFVFGIEDSVIHRYTDPSRCDNKLYVALTRAKKQLFVLQDASKPHLQFVDPQVLTARAEVISASHPTKWVSTHPYIIQQQRAVSNQPIYPKTTQVTNLLRHCHFEDLANIEALMCSHEILHPANEEKKANCLLMIENFITTSLTPLQTEEVSDLTGIAMQAWLEYKINGTLTTIGRPERWTSPLPAHRLLSMTNDFDATGATSYHSRRQQIQDAHHTWVKATHLDFAWTNFQRKINRDAAFKFEEKVSQTINELHGAPPHVATQMNGTIDSLEKDPDDLTKVTIWEVKFVSQIQSHHILQAATYGVMYWLSTGIIPTVYLYNIRTDQQIQIYLPETQEHALSCLRVMLYFKSAQDNPSPDDDFIRQSKSIVNQIYAS